MTTIQAATFNGIAGWQISNAALSVTVLPSWGGKIAAVYDRRRQRQWLHENIYLPYQQPDYGADYVRRHDVGGYDDCFPSVAPCRYPAAPWQHVAVPDHGDVWSLPWVAEVGVDAITLTVSGIHVPYLLTKTIRLLDDGQLHIDYAATNLTPFAMPFVWSSHPLFALRPGMRIRIPATRVVENDSGRTVSWPQVDGRDLSVAPDPATAVAYKLFTPPLTEGWAELHDPADGATFRFTFDPTLVTHVGLWLNYGGWSGVPGVPPYYNIGLEPCIGAADALPDAVRNHTHGTIPPHETVRWWLLITVT